MAVDSVILVGSGAIENAWSPVYRALTKTFGYDVTEPDQANLLMARLVFNVRFFKDGESKTTNKKLVGATEKAKGHLRTFRTILAEELIQATDKNEVLLRKGQISQIQSLLIGQSVAITTNWDSRYLSPIKTGLQIPLHGNIDNPDSLYLPAETSFDKNSSSEIEAQHTANHHNAISYVESAYQVVLWGLGINALDAELTVVFSEAFHEKKINNRPYKVIIVDRNTVAVVRKLEMFGVDKKFVQEITV